MLHIKSKMKALLFSLGAGLFLLGNSLTVEAVEEPIHYDEETDTAYFIGDATDVIDISAERDGTVCMYIFEDGTGLLHGNGKMSDMPFKQDGSFIYSLFCETNTPLVRVFITDNSHIIAGKYLDFMFGSCINLKEVDLSTLDTSETISMSLMFNYCSDLMFVDLPNSDTSNVTSMYSMFNECKSLRELNLSHLNTENVTSMSRMCYNCTDLQSINLTGLNTSNVEDVAYMFKGCSSLTKLDLFSFDLERADSSVKNIIIGCTNLLMFRPPHNAGYRGIDLPYEMYRELDGKLRDRVCVSYEGEWYLKTIEFPSETTDSDGNIVVDLSFKQDKSIILTIKENGVGTLSGNGVMMNTLPCTLSKYCAIVQEVYIDDNSSIIANSSLRGFLYNFFNLYEVDLRGLDTSRVTDMDFMFYNVGSWLDNRIKINLSDWDTGNVNSMNYMFASLQTADLSLQNWNTSNVVSMEAMFIWSYIDYLDISSFTVGEDVIVANMFNQCYEIKEIIAPSEIREPIYLQHIMLAENDNKYHHKLQTANDSIRYITPKDILFTQGGYDVSSADVICKFDVSEAQDGSVMLVIWEEPWSDCPFAILSGSGTMMNITKDSIDLTGVRCPNVLKVAEGSNIKAGKSLSGLCYDWSSLGYADLTGLDLSEVEDLSYMFSGCKYLYEVYFSNLQLDTETNISNMFTGCMYIEVLDLSEWVVENVNVVGLKDLVSTLNSLVIFNAPRNRYIGLDLCRPLYSNDNQLYSTTVLNEDSISYTFWKKANSGDLSVKNGTIQNEGTQECKVQVVLDSTFTITVPTSISLVLEDGIGYGTFEISVDGDIAGYECIQVFPEPGLFTMRSAGKESLTAYIDWGGKSFYNEDLMNGDNRTEGDIFVPGLSSGYWSGNFVVTVSKEISDGSW